MSASIRYLGLSSSKCKPICSACMTSMRTRVTRAAEAARQMKRRRSLKKSLSGSHHQPSHPRLARFSASPPQSSLLFDSKRSIPIKASMIYWAPARLVICETKRRSEISRSLKNSRAVVVTRRGQAAAAATRLTWWQTLWWSRKACDQAPQLQVRIRPKKTHWFNPCSRCRLSNHRPLITTKMQQVRSGRKDTDLYFKNILHTSNLP